MCRRDGILTGPGPHIWCTDWTLIVEMAFVDMINVWPRAIEMRYRLEWDVEMG